MNNSEQLYSIRKSGLNDAIKVFGEKRTLFLMKQQLQENLIFYKYLY